MPRQYQSVIGRGADETDIFFGMERPRAVTAEERAAILAAVARYLDDCAAHPEHALR